MAAATLLAGGTAGAQTTVSQLNGRLALTTPATGAQNVKVEVGPAAGAARVFGFPGLADGTTFNGVLALRLATGSGPDQVELDVQAPQSLDVQVDTGAGDAITLVKWKVLAGVDRAAIGLDIDSIAGGTQLASIEVDSEVRDLAVTIDTGNAREVSAKVLSDDQSDFLGVRFTATAPKTAVEVTSAAASADLDFLGTHPAGFNEVKYSVAQTRPAALAVHWDVTLGGGADTFEGKIAAPGSTVTMTGTVRGGGDNDLLLVESDASATVTGLTLNGGAGNDQLGQIVKGYFQLSQTLRATLLGGGGDDALVLTTDTAIRGTGLPNDQVPLVDGGLGFDLYNAFGLIRGCEGRL
jgi:hypothetical protein